MSMLDPATYQAKESKTESDEPRHGSSPVAGLWEVREGQPAQDEPVIRNFSFTCWSTQKLR